MDLCLKGAMASYNLNFGDKEVQVVDDKPDGWVSVWVNTLLHAFINIITQLSQQGYRF